ncbi:MAG: hypothetical protein HC914_21900, partial [Chloroflexaceae bacterium]|nr:hypothetical protein [Chloroflexaceae bacterium]
MAETPKSTTEQTSRRNKRQEVERTTQQHQAKAVAERRSLTKREREARDQRRFLSIVGVVLGLVILIIAGGVLYQWVIYPSGAVAQVGDTTFSRREYWQFGRSAIAQEVAQNLQLLALFGDNQQFGAQFQGRSPEANQRALLLEQQTDTLNEQIVTAWVNSQLIEQGAAELGVQVTEDEVNQEIAQTYAAFLPLDLTTPTDLLTDTGALTDTGTLTDTEALPTETPPPTPAPDAARDQVQQIAARIHSDFSTELDLSGIEPALSEDDFVQGLRVQQRAALLEQRVREVLVPEEGFAVSVEPERVQARQILLAVELPENASAEVREAAYQERFDEAEDLVEQLRDGADFAELAAEFSDDIGSRDIGGDIGFFDREGVSSQGAVYDPDLVAAAFALEEGEVSDPIRTQFGWHIIEVTSRETPDEEQQLRDVRQEAFDEWLEGVREQIEVRRFPEPTPSPEVPTTEPLPTPEPIYQAGPPTPLPAPEAPEITDEGGVLEVPPITDESESVEGEASSGRASHRCKLLQTRTLRIAAR